MTNPSTHTKTVCPRHVSISMLLNPINKQLACQCKKPNDLIYVGDKNLN